MYCPIGVSPRRATVLGLYLVVTGCAWVRFQSPAVPATQPAAAIPAPVEMRSGGLLVSRSGQAELGLTLANVSERTLWVGVQFRTPDSRSDCLLVKELSPRTESTYLCPQPAVQANADYPVQITIFGNLAQSEVLGRLNTRFRFDPADVQAVQPANRAADSGKRE